MDLYEVVMKLVGPVQPVGETRADDERFENLKTLTGLVDMLLFEIDRIAAFRTDHQFSVKRAGKHCADFIDQVSIPKE